MAMRRVLFSIRSSYADRIEAIFRWVGSGGIGTSKFFRFVSVEIWLCRAAPIAIDDQLDVSVLQIVVQETDDQASCRFEIVSVATLIEQYRCRRECDVAACPLQLTTMSPAISDVDDLVSSSSIRRSFVSEICRTSSSFELNRAIHVIVAVDERNPIAIDCLVERDSPCSDVQRRRFAKRALCHSLSLTTPPPTTWRRCSQSALPTRTLRCSRPPTLR